MWTRLSMMVCTTDGAAFDYRIGKDDRFFYNSTGFNPHSRAQHAAYHLSPRLDHTSIGDHTFLDFCPAGYSDRRSFLGTGMDDPGPVVQVYRGFVTQQIHVSLPIGVHCSNIYPISCVWVGEYSLAFVDQAWEECPCRNRVKNLGRW